MLIDIGEKSYVAKIPCSCTIAHFVHRDMSSRILNRMLAMVIPWGSEFLYILAFFLIMVCIFQINFTINTFSPLVTKWSCFWDLLSSLILIPSLLQLVLVLLLSMDKGNTCLAGPTMFFPKYFRLLKKYFRTFWFFLNYILNFKAIPFSLCCQEFNHHLCL